MFAIKAPVKSQVMYHIDQFSFMVFACFRLPLPWLLYSLFFGKPVPVTSVGMVCSITLLFCMLMLVFFSILTFNWKMTKGKQTYFHTQ